MSSLRCEPQQQGLALALAKGQDEAVLHWLGQAGFALRLDKMLVLIDPYLSDALAEKYATTALPHTRMMAVPIAAEALPRVDLVLVTHRHGDHLDRPTLEAIARHSPECKFVLPAAEEEQMAGLQIDAANIIGVDAGEHLTFGPVIVHPVPAAHETVLRNSLGQHHYLGYVLSLKDGTLYHSGDSVPCPELDEALSPYAIDLALLPVNGRDSYRANMGVPGNFTLEEAISLCRRHAIPQMIAHHFGMFDFNTIAPEPIRRAAAANAATLDLFAASLRTRYVLDAAGSLPAAADLIRAG